MFKLGRIKTTHATPQSTRDKVDPWVGKLTQEVGGQEDAQPATLLARAVTVDAIARAWVWEPECPYSRLGGSAVGTGVHDGVAGTSVCQPASITAVQAAELPSSKELAHRRDLCAIFQAGLPGFEQRQLLRVLQVVHPPCGKAGHLSAVLRGAGGRACPRQGGIAGLFEGGTFPPHLPQD